MSSDKELLQNAIEQIRTYNADERSPYSIEHFFLRLNEADQSENKELWKELRKALAESQQIKRKAPKKFFTRLYFADEGYWWWNPEEW
ncbi:hypothetical protein [Fodinibius halophilus]|uniref:Uncharacterized protein n=1 Tax=Fodinibius halophilus TaxID=1736908 RepID=A0A6M1SUP3_9BACT|nr:hypothetical protein [Fodinibius halophilus]NGP87688.1 hypothetical protein [Fodinibius halophilus]